MSCPRCGTTEISGPECPRCGVILARARPPRRPPRGPSHRETGRRGGALPLLGVGAGLVVTIVVVARWWPPSDPGRTTDPDPTAALTPPVREPSSEADRPEARRPGEIEGELATRSFGAVPPPADPLPPDTGEEDRRTAGRLAGLLSRGQYASAADIRAAEDLHTRYGDPARTLLEAVLMSAATAAHGERRYDEAEGLLRRAATIAPGSPRPARALVAVYLESGDWRSAEAAARAALALLPDDPEAIRGLAYALLRQDRSREAREVLEAYLEAHRDGEAQALLERLRWDAAPERGLTEQRLAHFHVRYDGEEHVDVGREILRVLDRHYATLVRTFDHQPRAPIPVILLSQRSFYEATGAPGWSGGLYDSFDGRVRIPIGGLTAALTPELDGTLLHELTHAFVTDRSQGIAPREIQEGLAQFVEGKRAEELLGEAGLRALADGRLRGVGGFYAASLSLVEYLVAQRGQGGINDLLAAMAETGNADEAFRRVYGRDFAGMRGQWATRLRHSHGS